MKCRIHFDGCEIVRVEFQPVSLGQIRGIENAAPVLKAPRARAETYLLLIGEVQNEIATLAQSSALGKGLTFGNVANIPRGALMASKT